jgi:hypothetical protein
MTAGVLEAVRVRMVASNLAPDRAAIAVHHGPDFGDVNPEIHIASMRLRSSCVRRAPGIADSTFHLINKTGVATAA